MNLIEIETCQAMIDRLKAVLPSDMAGSVINYLDRPEELTVDVLEAVHPKGLFMVQFAESVGEESERMIFGVYCLALGLHQVYKLTRAAKIILTGLAPYGGHQLALHKDEPVETEGGAILRLVTFRMNYPTLPIQSGKLAAKIAELEL